MWQFASSQFNQVNYNFYDKAQRRKQEHQTTKGAAMRAEKVEFGSTQFCNCYRNLQP